MLLSYDIQPGPVPRGAQEVDLQINEESQKSTVRDAHEWRMEEWRS